MSADEVWDGLFRWGIQCPHCNAVDEESCDYPATLRHDGDTTKMDCAFCGGPFTVTLSVTYEFSTALPAADDAKER